MKKALIIGIIFILVVVFIRFFIGGAEDSWICDKGQWIKHGNPSYPKPITSCKTQTALPKNKKDCLNKGGVWKKIGIDPIETCNLKARDRGNLCRDNSECEGICQVSLSRDELSQGMRGKLNKNVKYGQCSVWIVELGCQGIMKHGKTQVICID